MSKEDEKQQQIYEVIQVMKKLDNVIKTFDFEERLTNKMLCQEKGVRNVKFTLE